NDSDLADLKLQVAGHAPEGLDQRIYGDLLHFNAVELHAAILNRIAVGIVADHRGEGPSRCRHGVLPPAKIHVAHIMAQTRENRAPPHHRTDTKTLLVASPHSLVSN